ncbi:hypothetical protein [Paraburkholderia nodosa]|uniref:hypothetical protein n=1 Tax=Paraburkholderia nodosa TaxID=392320 RepID=UPI0004BBDEED|nr:hypothetical protein [Paraburkholderia nodosa]
MKSTLPMTAKERDAIRDVVKMRARLVKSDIDARATLLIAEAEAQLSVKYQQDDERWDHAIELAEQVARDADAELLRIAKRDGIPLENRPRFVARFMERSDYALKDRRDELRRLARAKVEAAAKDSKRVVERWQTETITALLAGTLQTDDAKAFLAALPTIDSLLPAMTMQQIDALVSGGNVLRLVSTGTDA